MYLVDWARRAASAARGVDADHALMAAMGGCIELAATRYAVDPGATYRAGAPLRLLLAGYCGTRNTGADVRVEEMIRQFRHLIGDAHLDLSVLTLNPARSRGYFATVKQLHLPQIYPRFLTEAVHQSHGAIACEGSMFKSKFANALATMMVGALGVARAEQKIAVGYGGEAGQMDPALQRFVERYARGSLVIARNEASADILAPLGVDTRSGTDTAWTFEAAPPERAETMLRDVGWGGEPVLAICPINPFWWPVKPDVAKGLMHIATGAHADAHYQSVYFHRAEASVAQRQTVYLDHLADAVRRFRDGRRVFPIAVGMEALDRPAVEGLATRLNIPTFVSDQVDMYDMVGLLRRCSMLASSRYHAIVTSMPAGVPSVGITMDERIRNLMVDRRTPELALTVEQPDLGEALYQALCRLDDPDLVHGIRDTVARNLIRMGEMGAIFVDHLRSRHPALPIRAELGEHGDPLDHLPPLSRPLRALLEEA